MEAALAIFLLALPIVCLLGGSIYCAVYLWRAQRKNKRAERLNDYVLHQASEVGRAGYLLTDENDDSAESVHRENKQTEQINDHALHRASAVCRAEHLLIDKDDDLVESFHMRDENTDYNRLLFARGAQTKHRRFAQKAVSTYIKIEQAKKAQDIPLRKLNKGHRIWLVCECFLYVSFSIIVEFLVSTISGEQVAKQDISLKEYIFCVSLAAVTIGFDLVVSKVDFSEISGWRSIVHAIFPKKFLFIILLLLLGISLAVLCISFFSEDITYWFSSSGGVLLFSCGVVSFLLIGNTVLNYARKMLEHVK